jgi:2-oxoglutarate dehydrogenase E2 component (dihydrolipoamide succinyltransferase)
MISIKVPPLGESIVEATVARWLKKDGDSVAAGETLVELETDKITVEVPAPKAGVLARRQAKEGDVVKVDQPLGDIDETAAGAKAGATAPAASAKQASAQQASAQQSLALPTSQPAASQSASAAAPSKSNVAQGAGGGVSHGGGQPAGAAPAPAPADRPAVKASPAAQRLATESGVDVGAVQGTGRGGVVSKPDVMDHVASGGASPATAAQGATAPAPSAPPRPAPSNGARETREKMTTRRKRIAENLLLAKQATALLTTFNEIDMSAVMKLRDRFKEKTEKQHGVKLTFMPFFVKAACMALKEIPVLNAQIDGDSVIYKHYVNMGIAVASDAGLVVPNIRDVDTKGVVDISRDIAEVAKRARRQADDGRSHRRHIHDHQRRCIRFARLDADSELSAGRHPRPAQDSGSSRRHRRQGGDPSDDVRRLVVRSPHRRRPALGVVPRAREGTDGGPREHAHRLTATSNPRRLVPGQLCAEGAGAALVPSLLSHPSSLVREC